MSLGADIPLFVGGAAVSLWSSWLLVTRLERFAHRFSLTEAALGLLAALAADAPEITSAVTALLHHDTGVGLGVVVGSNLFNLAALIGLGALVGGWLRLPPSVGLVEGVPALAIAVVSALALGRVVHPVVSLVLLLAITAPVVAVAVIGPKPAAHQPALERVVSEAVTEEEAEIRDLLEPAGPRRGDALIGLAALAAVVGASIFMERSAVSIGGREHVSQLVIGGIVLAAVTSIPNAVAAVYLALRRRPAALLAEASNSNTLNIVFGMALPAVLIGWGRPDPSAAPIGLWYVVLTAGAYALIVLQRGLTRLLGLLVILAYAAFVVWAVAR